MKTIILFAYLTLLNTMVLGQNNKGDVIIDDSKIKPWITEESANYQSLYHFSNSEDESTFLLIIDNDSCYAQIQSGEWGKTDD
jgi:hypothetical protein